MKDKPIILFDGVCNFCNSAVNFVIKNDKRSLIKFAAIQSIQGQQLLKEYRFPVTHLSSFVLIENGHAYTQSAAALHVCKSLGGLWRFFYGFIIVPKFIRDSLYNLVAKNRYKWFGRRDECMIPTPDVRQRFL